MRGFLYLIVFKYILKFVYHLEISATRGTKSDLAKKNNCQSC